MIRRGDAREIGDDVLDLGLGDHFLALQDAAEQQADDDQHDGDLDQREASSFSSFHSSLSLYRG
ncbi:hypothetical protein D3C83_203040 [compost metagenome]